MSPDEALAAAVRAEWGRLVSLLLRRFGRLDLVEDALADAVEAAARRWPDDGVPDDPAAWLHTVARRRVLDRLRAEALAQRTAPLLVRDPDTVAGPRADPGDLVADDLLRLVLMCAHPALDPAASAALSLRLVLGVSTDDVARLFLVPRPTMAARLTRAKRKIVAAGIPFTVPDRADLAGRLDVVAQTAYLAFTAGYAPGSGPDVVRVELAGEAVRLVRVVRDAVAGTAGEPVATALLALMLLQHSRRDARVDAEGGTVLLPDQDRSRWHREEIREALDLLASPVLVGPVTVLTASYAVQAAIAVEHATALTADATRWDRVVAGYDRLLALTPSPAARLARAVAVAEAAGPEAGLSALAELDDEPALAPGHRLPAVRGELAARAGRDAEARAAFDVAIDRCGSDAERALLARKRAALD